MPTKRLKIGFIMDPLEKLEAETDSSLFLIKEGKKRGHEIHYIIDKDLFVENGIAFTYSNNAEVKLENNGETFTHNNTLKNHDTTSPHCTNTKVKLENFDVIFVRKDPPFNMDYIYMTYILELVEDKVMCINHPSSIRTVNEKFYTQYFSDLAPQTLISKNPLEIKKFVAKYKKCIIKPLDMKGGAGIYIIDENDDKIIKETTENGMKYMVVQEFLEGVKTKGDKRILLLNGEPINALLRIPKEGSFKGNICAGAKAVKAKITNREQEICSKLSPILKEKKLYLVGIDLIDEKLTEINVTSPIIGFDLYPENAEKIYEFIEAQLQSFA